MKLQLLLKRVNLVLVLGLAGASFSGCADDPFYGPDKQFSGSLVGAATGAGAGAVTGFQLGAATGPAALVGAGFGAVAGGVHGAVKDRSEEDYLVLAARTSRERSRSYAQEILAEHFERRMKLHPTRDIFPADLFFAADETRLRPGGVQLVRELAVMNKNRLPWSRLAIVAYVKGEEGPSGFAADLASKRIEEIGDYLVRSGIDPRRIEAKPVIVKEPVLVDPLDDPSRYAQAIEFVPLDR